MSLGYITKKEFINTFQINRKTFEMWVKDKKLPIKRIGYKTYIQKNELEEWLKEFSINEPSLLDLKSIFN